MDPLKDQPGQQPPAPAGLSEPGQQPPQDTPATGRLVAVKIAGREHQLPEDVAQALSEREREFDRKLSEHSQELGQLRQMTRQWQERQAPTAPQRPAEPDIETLWFENPKAAAQKLRQEIRQEITGEYQRDQAIRSFWDGFYRGNDDLREDDFIVNAVFQRHFDQLADLAPAKAAETLADLTRKEIIRLSRKVKPATESNGAPPRHLAEPASGERPPRPAREEDSGPKTLSDAIRAIQRQKSQAARTGAKG